MVLLFFIIQKELALFGCFGVIDNVLSAFTSRKAERRLIQDKQKKS